MNILSFFKLLYTIFGGSEPDIEYIQSLEVARRENWPGVRAAPDFLDDERCRKLAQLYSNTASLPPEDSLALIASYAGSSYLDNFSSSIRSPLPRHHRPGASRRALQEWGTGCGKNRKKGLHKNLPPRCRERPQAFQIRFFFTPGSAESPTQSACSMRLRR